MATKLTAFSALILLLVAAALPQPAFAGTLPPLGYQLMCLKHPDQCQGGGSASVAPDAEIMATLKRVNLQVNRSITPTYDRPGADVWSVSTTAGDCEDYALAKRSALIAAGLPASSLRIAYVKTRSGEDHTVLVVKTSHGTLVLDNLTSAIRPLSQSGLRLVSMSGADPLHWS